MAGTDRGSFQIEENAAVSKRQSNNSYVTVAIFVAVVLAVLYAAYYFMTMPSAAISSSEWQKAKGCNSSALTWPAEKPIISEPVQLSVEQVTNELSKLKWPSNLPTPATMIEKNIPGFLGGSASPCFNAFNDAWMARLRLAFAERGEIGAQDLQEYFSTGKSGGYLLEMRVISAPPGFVFGTHAHPNIEYVGVLKGTLFENRLDTRTTLTEEERLAKQAANVTLPKGAGIIRKGNEIKSGTFFANEVGSVHQSYTSTGEGIAILALFSGLDKFVRVDVDVDGVARDLDRTPSGCGKGLKPTCPALLIQAA